MTGETVLILDFGGQYKELIARRVREHGVYSEIRSCKMPVEEIRAMAPKGIIFTGGPDSVYRDDSPTCDKAVLELGIPVVWNSSGYECVETLRMLDGLVQVYLPDLKYALSEPAARYSAAADYPQVARAAVLEMYRQTGPFRLDEDGLLQRGVLIRHLILPRQAENTRRVIDWVGETFAPGQVLFSLMSQYTPVGDLAQWPELQHPISPELNEEMYQYLIDSPIADGFYQDLDAATGDMIPAFDGTGV